MTLEELLRPLTAEELEKIVPLSDEEIEKALKEGREEYRLELESTPTFPGHYL